MKSRNKNKRILLRTSKTTQNNIHRSKYIYQESTLSTIASHQTLHASKNETYICKHSPLISTSKQIHPFQNQKLLHIYSFINKQNCIHSYMKSPHLPNIQTPIKRSFQRQNSLSSSVSVNSLTTTETASFKLKRSYSNASNHSGGTVNIVSIPTKINNVNLNLYEHNSVIRYDIMKIILIQSMIRMFLLRKVVYVQIMKGYKVQKGIYHIEKAFEMNCSYLKWLAFYKINKDEEIKYYVNEKEFELLNELKKWKITSIDDYDTFTFWITGDE